MIVRLEMIDGSLLIITQAKEIIKDTHNLFIKAGAVFTHPIKTIKTCEVE